MKKDSKPDSLLVEIRCEELPPAVLWSLADSFPDSLLRELQAEGFADSNSHRAKNERGDTYQKLATPRRLIALLKNIKGESPPREIFRRGPKLTACKDGDGRPTKALVGFMQSVGATCENDLARVEEKGNVYIAWRGEEPGCKLADNLAALTEKTLLNLPAPRRMRWGENEFKFIRPIRAALMQHGEKTIHGNVMGIPASDHTVGHPTLSPGNIKIASADNYESTLCDSGKVRVDLDLRLGMIRKELFSKELLDSEDGHAIMMDSADEVRHNTAVIVGEKNRVPETSLLLREVAAMCEWPICYWRRIDEEFMSLPRECIAECMKKHQKFFPFIGGDGPIIDKMLRDYCLVADSEPTNSEAMLRGYDSVLRARLRDVQFYFSEDRKLPLSECVEKLKAAIFHRKLGSQHDRIARVCKIAAAIVPVAGVKCLDAEVKRTMGIPDPLFTMGFAEYPERNPELQEYLSDAYYAIAPMDGINADAAEIKQTAEKILAPLSTMMCAEHPELQEYLSEKYFGEMKHFHFVILCYELEKLAAMFGIGEIPTGSKDPHGLRRAALNVARVSIDRNVNIKKAIAAAVESFDDKIADCSGEIYDFVLERLRFMLSPRYPYMVMFPLLKSAVIESVLSSKPDCIALAIKKAKAVQAFLGEHPFSDQAAKADALIAADKRIRNIFRKSKEDAEKISAPDPALFSENAERELWEIVKGAQTDADAHLAQNNFADALKVLSGITESLEKFFDEVMVNAEDEQIRVNRFALLKQIRKLLNCVADLSFLSSESGG